MSRLIGVDWKWLVAGQNDAIDVRPEGANYQWEGLTRIIVDWSGSWQAARPGN